MRVIVKRLSGNKVAPDILADPICNTQSVGVRKGKTFLYDNGMDKYIYTITLPYRGIMYPSDLVAVFDSSLGESFVGRITGHLIRVTNTDGSLEVTSELTIERSEEITN